MDSKDLSSLLRKQWEIDSYSPINILNETLEHMKTLTIVWMPLNKQIKGCCSKKENNSLIILNSKQNIGSQNFTIAHELYHLLFENPKEWIICSDDNNTESEKKANLFATHLLLPNASLYNYQKKHDIYEWNIEDMISCEQYFQINHEELVNRLNSNDFDIKIDENEDLLIKAKKLGYDIELYQSSKKPYYSLGHFIRLTEKEFENKKFSIGKRNELLKSVFRSDIIDNF